MCVQFKSKNDKLGMSNTESTSHPLDWNQISANVLSTSVEMMLFKPSNENWSLKGSKYPEDRNLFLEI